MKPCYLDANATTPLAAEALAAMQDCLADGGGNASSQHAWGRRARRRLEDAREEVGRLLGARLDGPRPDRVLFTSGGTESNNLALLGLAAALRRRSPGEALRCYAAGLEHPSVLEPLQRLEEQGWQRRRWPVAAAGTVDLAVLEQLLQQDRAAGAPAGLAALMRVNHETGAVQPVAEAVRACAAQGVWLHCDAVQAAGKLPVDFAALGAATLSVSAHKFQGPQGVGGLLIRGDVPLTPILWGGFQQYGWRPGTEPVWLIVGMQAALGAAVERLARESAHLFQGQQAFEAALCAGVPGATIHAAAAPRVPTVCNAAFPQVDRQALLVALDLAGIACATGSACASGSSEPSPTLRAMGCDEGQVGSSLRFSWSPGLPVAELVSAASRICQTYHELRQRQKAGNSRATARSSGPQTLD